MSAMGDKTVNIGRRFEASVFCEIIDDYIDQCLSILLNDLRLGSADDIGIILRGNSLICIQAKSSENDNVWCLHDLITGQDSKTPSTLKKLYESYISITKTFPHYQIKIMYITNRFPTQSKRNLPKFKGDGISFLDFIKKVWEPFKRNDKDENEFLEPGIKNEWFKKFQEHLNIENQELLDFFKHLEFKYGIEFFEHRPINEQKKFQKYYDWFLKAKMIYEDPIPCEKFLEDIKLSYKLMSQDFPVDESTYVRNVKLNEQVTNSIAALEKGYIFLQGGPGTGKSTFLQMEINPQSLPETRIFKFLCHRDDRYYTLKPRGELEVFLKEMNGQFSTFLERNLINDDESDKFLEYLNDLSHYASSNNLKILLLIDGVDHISRKQKVTQSFLKKLPNPVQLPNKLIFLISGQHFYDIEWSGDSTISRDIIKRIEMEPFNVEKIKEYLFKKYHTEFHIDQLNRLLQKTQGNPLFLKILCDEYQDSSIFLSQFDELMQAQPNFKNNVNQLYEDYWHIFEFESENFLEAAGLLSRIIGPIDINWLEKWPEAYAIQQIIEKFNFLFVKVENLILFEYNTFKDFLYNKSATIFNNRFSENKSKQLYSKLLRYCEKYNSSEIHDWYKLGYLIELGMMNEILQFDRPYFIRQFLQFRPIYDILEDIIAILEYSYSVKNFEAIFKFLLIKAEFELRALHYVEFLEDFHYLLRIFIDDSEKIFYIIATLLQSEGLDYVFKLKLIKNSLRQKFLREKLSLLFKDFYNQNKAAIPSMYHPRDFSKFIDSWIFIPFNLDANIESIFKSFNLIFPDSFEKHYHKSYYLISEYIFLVFKFGSFLIAHNLTDQLNLVYTYIEEIIKKGKWIIYADKGEVFFKNQEQDKIAHQFINEFNSNPFIILFKLKLRESYFCNSNRIEDFLGKYPLYIKLWEGETNSLYFKLKFDKKEMNEKDIQRIFEDGLLMRSGSSKDIGLLFKNRFWFYRNLKSICNITDDDDLLEMFNRKGKEKGFTWLIVQKSHHLFQWELKIRDFALLDKEKFEEKIVKKVISMILDFMNCEINDETQIWHRNFKEILFVFMDEIKLHFPSIKNWFYQLITSLFNEGRSLFQVIFNQLRIYEKLRIEFELVEIDERIKNLIEMNKDFILNIADPWEDITNFQDCIGSLAIIKNTKKNYILENSQLFKDLFEKITFRIGPRKDYQLFFLLRLIENIIQFFDSNDEEMKKQILWISKILIYTHKKTEHNSTDIITTELIKIVKDWNSEVAFEILETPDYIYYEDDGQDDYFPENLISIDVEESELRDLSQLLKNSVSEFHVQIREIYEQGGIERFDYDLKELFYCIYSLNENLEDWLGYFNHLTVRGPYPHAFFKESDDFSVISKFLDFFEELSVQDNQLEHLDTRIKVRIAQAKLYSPGSRYTFETSLKELHELNPNAAFEWGWANLNLLIRRKDITWSIIAGSDWLIYTFLYHINRTNYKIFWDIYFGYLKKLFDFIPMSK